MSAFRAFCSEWPYAVVFSFSVSQYTSDITVVLRGMNSTTRTSPPCHTGGIAPPRGMILTDW
jgi:hypothetical protein